MVEAASLWPAERCKIIELLSMSFRAIYDIAIRARVPELHFSLNPDNALQCSSVASKLDETRKVSAAAFVCRLPVAVSS